MWIQLLLPCSRVAQRRSWLNGERKGLASACQMASVLMRLVSPWKFTTYSVQGMPLLLALFTDIYTTGIGTNQLAWATLAAQSLSHDMAARISWDMKKKC